MVIASYKPLDVTQFRSRDAAAAVLLAHSLNWTVTPRANGPVSLVAADGKHIRVPDNTGIKMDVFRGWIHQIATHSGDQSINRKLVDTIVHQTKLGREHARLMYELAEDDLGPDDYGPVEKPEVPIEETPPLLPTGWYDEKAVVLTREPYKAEHSHATEPFAYKRTWSDERVDYECMRCNRSFSTLKAVSAHQQFHIRRGQVPGKTINPRAGAKQRRRTYIPPDEPIKKAALRPPEPSTTRMIEVSEEVATDALAALKMLEQIKSLLGAGEVSALKDELAVKDARIAQLEGNLQALRDLLAGDL